MTHKEAKDSVVAQAIIALREKVSTDTTGRVNLSDKAEMIYFTHMCGGCNPADYDDPVEANIMPGEDRIHFTILVFDPENTIQIVASGEVELFQSTLQKVYLAACKIV